MYLEKEGGGSKAQSSGLRPPSGGSESALQTSITPPCLRNARSRHGQRLLALGEAVPPACILKSKRLELTGVGGVNGS